jgi:4-hydroxybenzoate polyprenyltransferase
MADQAIEPGVLLVDRQRHWAYRLPPAWRDLALLARWDRPIGTWLLLLPCWWGMALAGPRWGDLWLGLAFAVGAFAMRGAGCTINDMADRDLDARVARTRNRPLAAGRVSLRRAALFVLAQMALGLAVLATLDVGTALLAVCSLPIVLAYPFAKRVTWWPQLVLGLAFNWGALVGYRVLAGELRAEALLLYAAGILWTLGYDTIYAHQDKEDDALIGVRSTALRLAGATRGWLVGFYGGMIVLLAGAGALAGLGLAFYVGLGLAAWLLSRQVRQVDLDDPADCLRKFRANRLLGIVVTASLLAGHLPF